MRPEGRSLETPGLEYLTRMTFQELAALVHSRTNNGLPIYQQLYTCINLVFAKGSWDSGSPKQWNRKFESRWRRRCSFAFFLCEINLESEQDKGSNQKSWRKTAVVTDRTKPGSSVERVPGSILDHCFKNGKQRQKKWEKCSRLNSSNAGYIKCVAMDNVQ
jgi:hypothetical protein